jgi:hypothetical protein
MYCQLHRISGMEAEHDYCAAMLRTARPRENCIALIYMNNTGEWVYGQCTFKREPDDPADFKFSNEFAALKAQGVLPALISEYAVTALLVDDRALADRIRTDPLTSKYGGLVTMLTRKASGFERPPPTKSSFLSRLGIGAS